MVQKKSIETDKPVAYYEQDAKNNHLWGTHREIALSEHILSKAKINRKIKTLIDIGCGDGFLLSVVQKKFKNIELNGLDLSDKRLARTQKNVPSVVLHQSSIDQLPFKDHQFDLVICSEVLEHLEDPIKALEKLWRITNHQLIITVPNNQPTTNLECPHCLSSFYLSGHLHQINEEKLKKWAEVLPDAKVSSYRFHTIFSYNNKTLKWPKLFRTLLDKFLIHTEPLIGFTKANYLMVSITRTSRV